MSRHLDRIIASALGLATFIVLRLTSTPIGFTRDEGYYFKAAAEYIGWYRAIAGGQLKLLDAGSAAAIQRYFSFNHEHPILIKTMQGLAWWVWHELFGVGLNSEAFRLPGPLMAAPCVVLTYLLGAKLYGRDVGIFAALAFALMPRNFFHEHLACFDVPVTTMTVLVVYAYIRSETSLARAAWAGVAFGLCMATKHNSLFIAPLLIIHWVAVEGWRIRREASTLLRIPGIPAAFAFMMLIGPLIFFAHWPWLWHDTLRRLGEYYGYHFFSHEHYPITYFGRLLRTPPFPYGFSFGMTLVTMPLPLLGLMALGLGRCVKDGFFTPAPDGSEAAQRRSAAWLLGLFALAPMVIISLPSTPIFGGVKHWMPATPFLAIMAGYALRTALLRIRTAFPSTDWLQHPRVFYAVAPLFLVTAVTGILRSAPHGHSSYNELIGGARGAALVGMQRHYWGEASRPLIPTINEKAPQGARLFFNRTNWDSHRMYIRDGILRRDIGYANSVPESTLGVSFHQWEHEHELYNLWNHYGNRKPLAGEYLEGGVPLTQLYSRQSP